MGFKEFLQKCPEDVKKAKACKDLSEFKKLVNKAGISYKDDSELKKAFDFVKNSQGELSDDDLNAVAGGKDENPIPKDCPTGRHQGVNMPLINPRIDIDPKVIR